MTTTPATSTVTDLCSVDGTLFQYDLVGLASCHPDGAVTLEDADSGDEVVYTIVGEDESDAKKGRISITSPMARALIGKEIDATVKFKAPGGMREYDIMDVVFGDGNG